MLTEMADYVNNEEIRSGISLNRLLVSIWMIGFINTVVISKVVNSELFTRVSTPVGLKAKLPCSTEITGSIHVQWLDPSGTTLTFDETVETGDSRIKISHIYLKEWNLEIENVRRSDAGNYTCNIGPTPVINKVVELLIVVAPSIRSSSGDTTAPIGSTVSLTCVAYGEPEPIITWSRHISSTSGSKYDLHVNGTVFNISAVTVEDAGAYECQANNNVPPPAFARMRLDIMFPPEISILFREVSQEEGGSTLMTCLVKANPTKDICWVRNGTCLLPSEKYQFQRWEVGEYQTTFGMFVNDLVQSDFGDYRCIAVNDYGQAEGSITIHEFQTGSIRILSTPKDSLSRRGEDVLMQCSVHGITHGNSLVWWRGSRSGKFRKIFMSHLMETRGASTSNISSYETVLLDHRKYEIRGHYDLYMKQVNFNDSGMYKCEITGQRNYTAQLTVVDTRLSCRNIKTYVYDGDPVLMICSLGYSGSAPRWQIRWLHDEEPVFSDSANDTDGRIEQILQFNASYPQSTGIYRCVVSAPQLNYSATCRLELTVFSSRTGGNIDPCDNSSTAYVTSGELKSFDPSALEILVLLCIAVFFLMIYIVTVCCLVTYHRQELAKYKQHETKEKSNKNGDLEMELRPLTCASPQPSV